MDWTKYPLEKAFYFVAGVIPGLAALSIYALGVPGAFNWFLSLGALGYKTKIAVVVLVAFVIGNSITAILGGLMGAVIGAALGVRLPKLSYQYDFAPWRDTHWRALVRDRLGQKAPRDVPFITQAQYEAQLKQPSSLPVDQIIARNHELIMQLFNAQQDDQEWQRWYNHYHEIVLTPDDKNFALHIQNGLYSNLEATAIYALASSIFVAQLRHWWCILPACLWAAKFGAELFVEYRRRTDPWTTFSLQVKYLSDTQDKQAAAASGASC